MAWREPIRLMVERDDLVSDGEMEQAKAAAVAEGKEPPTRRDLVLKRIEYVIRWSQDDSFWARNVLSGEGLRDHYDQLEAAIRKEIAGKGGVRSKRAKGNAAVREALRRRRDGR